MAAGSRERVLSGQGTIAGLGVLRSAWLARRLAARGNPPNEPTLRMSRLTPLGLGAVTAVAYVVAAHAGFQFAVVAEQVVYGSDLADQLDHPQVGLLPELELP
jgi:hypothetical protein